MEVVCIPPLVLSGNIPWVQCHTVIVNFCSMWFCQPLHMHKLKDDMILVYVMFSGLRTKQARYSSLQLLINSYSSRTCRIWADTYNQRGRRPTTQQKNFFRPPNFSTRNLPSVFPYLVKLNNNGSYPELKIY